MKNQNVRNQISKSLRQFNQTYDDVENALSNYEFDSNYEFSVNFELEEGKIGNYFAVRPCMDEYEDETFVGIFIGVLNSTKPNLYINNPVIYIPRLKKIVLGIQSFYKKIETPEDLVPITDERLQAFGELIMSLWKKM